MEPAGRLMTQDPNVLFSSVASASEASSRSAVAPVIREERIASIDVLRGVALLGILWMNIVAFALPGAAYADPTVAGGARGSNLLFWLFSQILVEGKMRTIFSMLFGAGVVLFTSRAEARGGEVLIGDLYYRRTLWLIAFGLLHAYFIWSGDILYGYGVAGLLLFPFRRLKARTLIVTGLVVLAILVPKTILASRRIERLRHEAALASAAEAAGHRPTDEQRDARDAWRVKLKEMKPSPSEVTKEVADHRSGYWTLFPRRVEEVSDGQSRGFYRYGIFDVAGMMLIGMGLLKLGVFSAARSLRFYAAMAAVGYALGVPLTWWISRRAIAADFDPARVFLGYSGYDLARLAVAFGHIGVVMLICRSGLMRGVTSRLAAVGQMALTNYLATSIVCVLIFDGIGLGLFGRPQRIQLLLVVFPVWIAQMIASPLWLRSFRFGPMEWIWRSLTHCRLQPLRIRTSPRESLAVTPQAPAVPLPGAPETPWDAGGESGRT
jgi:uncharacterized protein